MALVLIDIDPWAYKKAKEHTAERIAGSNVVLSSADPLNDTLREIVTIFYKQRELENAKKECKNESKEQI